MAERWVSFTNLPLLEQARARLARTLTDGVQLNMSTEESKKLLRRHVNTKTNLVIMIIDINNSTEMSLSLPENKFALMVQGFAQEVSIAVLGYGGYVLYGEAQYPSLFCSVLLKLIIHRPTPFFQSTQGAIWFCTLSNLEALVYHKRKSRSYWTR